MSKKPTVRENKIQALDDTVRSLIGDAVQYMANASKDLGEPIRFLLKGMHVVDKSTDEHFSFDIDVKVNYVLPQQELF